MICRCGELFRSLTSHHCVDQLQASSFGSKKHYDSRFTEYFNRNICLLNIISVIAKFIQDGFYDYTFTSEAVNFQPNFISYDMPLRAPSAGRHCWMTHGLKIRRTFTKMAQFCPTPYLLLEVADNIFPPYDPKIGLPLNLEFNELLVQSGYHCSRPTTHYWHMPDFQIQGVVGPI